MFQWHSLADTIRFGLNEPASAMLASAGLRNVTTIKPDPTTGGVVRQNVVLTTPLKFVGGLPYAFDQQTFGG